MVVILAIIIALFVQMMIWRTVEKSGDEILTKVLKQMYIGKDFVMELESELGTVNVFKCVDVVYEPAPRVYFDDIVHIKLRTEEGFEQWFDLDKLTQVD